MTRRPGALRSMIAAFALAAGIAVTPVVAQSDMARGAAMTLAGHHPAAYYRKAMEFFAAGKRDDAVFVFYLGQLRYRTHLAARRGTLKPDGDPALFGALSETVGRPINEWAFGDIPALLRTLDQVLAFDRANPDTFTPAAQFARAHAQVRSGLEDMRRQLERQADSIRAQRLRNGFTNRN